MDRRAEQHFARRDLDDAAAAHDGDAVGHVVDDREIVRDEEIGEAEFAAQIVEEIENLRLHRDVERRDRFIADEQLRSEREGARDADALALAARETMRIAAEEARIEAGRLHQRLDRREPASGHRRDRGSPAARTRMFCTVMRGDSELTGSWNTIWMRERRLIELVAIRLDDIDRPVAAVEDDRADIGRDRPHDELARPWSCRNRFRRRGRGIRRA